MEEFVARPAVTTVDAPPVVEARFMRNIERLTDAEIMPVMRDWLVSCPIACVDWPEYPYAPKVSFRVAHSDECLAVMFEVEEEHVRAVTIEDNGPVWEDSCVEFFVADPVGDGYFNFVAQRRPALRRGAHVAHTAHNVAAARLDRCAGRGPALVARGGHTLRAAGSWGGSAAAQGQLLQVRRQVRAAPLPELGARTHAAARLPPSRIFRGDSAALTAAAVRHSIHIYPFE